MIAIVVAVINIDEIRMGINPNDFKIFVVSMESMKGGTANRMVSSNGHNHALRVLL